MSKLKLPTHASIKSTLLQILIISWLTAACQFQQQSNSTGINITDAADSIEIFAPHIISTPLNERDLAIAPDGKEIFYTLSTFDNSFRALIQVKQKNGKWQSPHIASFSGKHNDIEPFFSPDGNKLYFASDRPIDNGDDKNDYNIWYVTKSNSEWTNPTSIGTTINTQYDEFFPAVTNNGNLYFTARYPGHKGGEDIYISENKEGKYLTPHPLDSNINTSSYEFNAYVAPDEDLIIFSSYGRADGLGGGDLYISTKNRNGNWNKAQHLGPDINSSGLDYCPFIDQQNNIFYFTSQRRASLFNKQNGQASIKLFKAEPNVILNGMGNIYKIDKHVIQSMHK